jgi:hypothetical protein
MSVEIYEYPGHSSVRRNELVVDACDLVQSHRKLTVHEMAET